KALKNKEYFWGALRYTNEQRQSHDGCGPTAGVHLLATPRHVRASVHDRKRDLRKPLSKASIERGHAVCYDK
ncbi:hypothetical protein, partial [Caballeronia humi]|uniref:hypothetical protein n=1 Tax=Caballeronia humi TaxID=326474 RepID=UPI001F40E146